MTESNSSEDKVEDKPLRRFEDLPAPAQRALMEARERRQKLEKQQEKAAKEVGGRGGEDPARYGDWEVKGIAIDF